MGYKSNELKDMNRIINYFKRQLDYVKYLKADNGSGKYTESYDEGGNHKKRKMPNKGNPTLTRNGGQLKYKIINYKAG